jgi:NADPH2 dehydrogenase
LRINSSGYSTLLIIFADYRKQFSLAKGNHVTNFEGHSKRITRQKNFKSMASLFAEIKLNGLTLKNRVVFPPVVCFHYAGDDGFVTDRNVEHYSLRAAGGAGLVIVEATSVMKEGRLAPFQLGIWSDDHIPGLNRIARAIKMEDAVAMIQIHHAGIITPETVSPFALAPSAMEENPRSQTLTVEEIDHIRISFIAAAIYAQKAGFDGVELHGAHGYLLNQFANPAINKRIDEYGGDLKRNLKLAREIILGIRKHCGENFLIGYRLGANSPTLEDGVLIARELETYGVNLLHVSHGGNLQNLPRPPKGFEYNWIVYSGITIRSQVHIPVIAVNEIKTPERAKWLIEHDQVDLVALARPQLADPSWANNVMNDQPVNGCSSCKPRCRWYEESNLCPAVQRLKVNEAGNS